MNTRDSQPICRNNARVAVLGSLAMVSDAFIDAAVTVAESGQTFASSGNGAFAQAVLSWALQDRGVLRVKEIKHYVREPAPAVNPAQYRINDEVSFEITLEVCVRERERESCVCRRRRRCRTGSAKKRGPSPSHDVSFPTLLCCALLSCYIVAPYIRIITTYLPTRCSSMRNGQERRNGQWVPYTANDFQIEFQMLDAYVRRTLDPIASTGVLRTDFKVPDVYGVFKYVLKYVRPGYSRVERSITVRGGVCSERASPRET